VRFLPHQNVYARIKPSKIHGVGVFAVRKIPKGRYIFSEDNDPIVWVDRKSVKKLPKALKDFYDDFCIITRTKYGCPRHFDALTTSWYLNHSERPNVAADRNYRFYALRDIKAGEELTVNYKTYSELPRGRSPRLGDSGSTNLRRAEGVGGGGRT
jgi:hypothetical protein